MGINTIQNILKKRQHPLEGLILLAGDASDRKFYRCQEPPAICIQMTSWTEGFGGNAEDWISLQQYLHSLGIPVPEILFIDKDKKQIWISDLGDTFLNETPYKSYYNEALSLLIRCQQPSLIEQTVAHTRSFDEEKLGAELQIFTRFFFQKLWPLKHQEKIQKEFQLLAKTISSYDRVFCHRDYHSKNLMISNHILFWIDFQDARLGPHTYDVVSLLRDSYVKLDKSFRDELFDFYIEELNKKSSLRQPIEHREFYNKSNAAQLAQEYLHVGLQRNLKAIGSFSYLAYEKKKTSYLSFILQSLSYILEDGIIKEYPVLFNSLSEIKSHPEKLKERIQNEFELDTFEFF